MTSNLRATFALTQETAVRVPTLGQHTDERPRRPHADDFPPLAAAAAAGGFTQVFALPDNKPVTDNKAQVEYIRLGSQHLPASILPIGAITK